MPAVFSELSKLSEGAIFELVDFPEFMRASTGCPYIRTDHLKLRVGSDVLPINFDVALGQARRLVKDLEAGTAEEATADRVLLCAGRGHLERLHCGAGWGNTTVTTAASASPRIQRARDITSRRLQYFPFVADLESNLTFTCLDTAATFRRPKVKERSGITG
ncbi:hypothetical protein PF010_g26700 [Phytophthora fragariae]|uniref:Uncharacterized protein n=1 Tax=Phytophthora fragariae TaxID=53985 RepID=A0A6G0JW22_9STRA|nr:hypothetical protein PF010_g26700 [Phytophthora fragariae]